VLPPTEHLCQFISAERLVNDGKYKDAKKAIDYLLHELPDHTRLHGMAAYQMAEVYRNQGDETQYASYLAKAAVSDIKACVSEGLALPKLAEWLYEQGELKDAFSYINFALEDASSGNARMRTAVISKLVPFIDEAYKKEIDSSHNQLLVYFFLTAFLLILAGILLFMFMKQTKKSRVAHQKLKATSKIQESYIGNFLGLCSTYASKLDSFSKLVVRKISSGQNEELLKIIKSGKFAESQNEDFHKIFDNAFLDIYPDFIFRINQLLRDDEQILVKKGQGLTPELRIYALVRLGVEESTRISQILHYSVSTIYTYRNKMRNKAINRENFDKDVVEIGTDI
jgi:tetratricopeptide (TPR) repeat protein